MPVGERDCNWVTYIDNDSKGILRPVYRPPLEDSRKKMFAGGVKEISVWHYLFVLLILCLFI